MKIVIQCAGSKTNDAGSLRTADAKLLKFVANPNIAPFSNEYHYARPDDISENGKTWRELLLEYNKSGNNPYNILPAYQLYKNSVYRNLVNKFGSENIYILSAGWGLIPADFLTPNYDITFSSPAPDTKHTKRYKKDIYNDFNLLENDEEEIVFLGGKSYLPLFIQLTKKYNGKKKIIFNSKNKPKSPSGFDSILYETTANTNWQYICANALVDGNIKF